MQQLQQGVCQATKALEILIILLVGPGQIEPFGMVIKPIGAVHLKGADNLRPARLWLIPTPTYVPFDKVSEPIGYIGALAPHQLAGPTRGRKPLTLLAIRRAR
jgi:hypothetical protein